MGAITEFLEREGQFLLSMADLVEPIRMAIDDVIVERERATLEAVLEMSAEDLAGKRREKGSMVGYG